MAVYALTGNDTLIINERVIKDLADGSTINITLDNDSVGMSTGKDDNTVFSDNRQGSNATLELRLIRGSAQDIYFNGLSIQQSRDLPAFSLMKGSFTKRIGDGYGNVKFDNYVLLGGVFTKRMPQVNENLNGETDQGVSVYNIKFAIGSRSLG
jgi:hypothetical protein